jgi:glucose dehydrogenase
VVGETVYVSAGVYEDDTADYPGGSLLALNREDGTKQWQTTFDNLGGGYAGCLPIVHRGSVYVGDAGRHSLYAVDARSGRVRWHRNLGGSVNYPVVAESGTVCLARQEAVIGFDTMGTELWRYSIPDHVFLQTPAIHDGTLYAGSIFNRDVDETTDNEASLLIALDIESGEELWSAPRGENFNAIVYDVDTIFASGSHAVHAVSVSDGARLWKQPLDDLSPNQLAIDPESVYVVGDQAVAALDRTDGAVRWRFEPQAYVRTDPVVLRETVVVASEHPQNHEANATVYGLDKSTGDVRWQFNLPANMGYSAAAVDDVVYLSGYRTNGSGVITALSPSDAQ